MATPDGKKPKEEEEGYNTANNVSNCGGDPVTQLIVNVYQMKFIPQMHM